jgi:hypothetical protein
VAITLSLLQRYDIDVSANVLTAGLGEERAYA